MRFVFAAGRGGLPGAFSPRGVCGAVDLSIEPDCHAEVGVGAGDTPDLAAAVAQLSKKQRTVFLLKFSEDLSVEEIAQMLDMGVNTVRTHLHRALTAVRGRLGGSE